MSRIIAKDSIRQHLPLSTTEVSESAGGSLVSPLLIRLLELCRAHMNKIENSALKAWAPRMIGLIPARHCVSVVGLPTRNSRVRSGSVDRP